jgi:HK97 family phage prohead protease
MSEPLSAYERVCHADLSIRSDGRTVYGIVMPYGVETRVNDGRGPYTEVFHRGAFAKTIRERGDRIKLNVNHDKYHQLPIGRAITFNEDAKGLHGEFRVSSTEAGDEALTLIRDGVADSFSAGFHPVIPGPNDPIPRNGLVERLEAKLDHVALVAFPAYEGARVGGVRFDFDQFWDELSPEEQEAARQLDLPALIRSAAQQHVDVTPDEAAPEGTSDEADKDAAGPEEPPIEAADRTSDGHSFPHKPAQRPTKTPDQLKAEAELVRARVAAVSARSA